MKHLIAITIMNIITISSVTAACPKSLSMGWESAKPFQYLEQGEVKGIDIETAKVIFKEMNCELKLREIPWERHLAEVSAGTIDIASGSNITKERAEYANFSVPYLTEYVYLYALKENIKNIKFKNEKELGKLNLKIGVISGAHLGPEFEKIFKEKKWIDHNNLFSTNDEKRLVELLLAKRIDVFILGEYVNNINKSIIDHPQKMFQHTTHFMFSKKTVDKDFIKDFNKALNKLNEKGIIKKIHDKYTNDKTQKY